MNINDIFEIDEVKFDRAHNRVFALNPNLADHNTIYFTTDTHTIVMNGQEYGCSITKLVQGYYHENEFYEDSAHTKKITPNTSDIYVDKPSGKNYRYNGSQYVELSDFILYPATSDSLGGVIIGGGINVSNTGLISIKSATSDSLGGIKVGDNLSITADGVLSATGGGASYTPGDGINIESNIISVKPDISDNKSTILIGTNGIKVRYDSDYFSSNTNGLIFYESTDEDIENIFKEND